MTYAFGGASNYDGKSMEDAHAKARAEGLNGQHFDKVAGHLVSTLQELNVPSPLINEVVSVVGPTKEAIVGKA